MERINQIKDDFDALCHVVTDALRTDGLYAQIRTYVLSAIMQIWGSNVLYAPDYVQLTEAIAGKKYTMEQIVTAMGCCAEEGRVLAVPQFFKDLVQHDKDTGSRDSDTFLEKLNILLVASATVNGDFTVEEANALGVIYGALIAYVDKLGLLPPAKPDYTSSITPRDDSTYLQRNSADTVPETNKDAEEKKPADDSDGSINITINTLNINGDSASEIAPNTEAALASSPEEAATVTNAADATEETLESLLAELDSLVGLGGVKQDVHSLMNFIKVTKIREQRGMKVPKMSYHLVFTGNPGTGKTTIARLVAKLYFHMGLLPQGQLVETDRSALVAGYLGQTAIKTQKVIQQALGGVLFIDEAYSLAGETDDSYGKEAIETILKAMEDHRDELIVIVAGYTELMHKFIDSNPGLSSRFSKYFEFPDYTGEELLAIFRRFCKKNGYRLTDDAAALLGEEFNALYATRDSHFGNARAARNIFEKAINAQANRIAMQSDFSDDDLECLTSDDIAQAIGGVNT